MDDVTKEAKREILNQKLQIYKNTYYSHGVDAKVAKDIGETQMLQAATDNMARAQKMIDAIEGMVAELEDS